MSYPTRSNELHAGLRFKDQVRRVKRKKSGAAQISRSSTENRVQGTQQAQDPPALVASNLENGGAASHNSGGTDDGSQPVRDPPALVAFTSADSGASANRLVESSFMTDDSIQDAPALVNATLVDGEDDAFANRLVENTRKDTVVEQGLVTCQFNKKGLLCVVAAALLSFAVVVGSFLCAAQSCLSANAQDQSAKLSLLPTGPPTRLRTTMTPTTQSPSIAPTAWPTTKSPTVRPTPGPTVTVTTQPTTEFKSFLSTQELYDAVDEYVDSENNATSSPVAALYGHPIGSWDVSRIRNFNRVFDRLRSSKVSNFNEDIRSWNVTRALSLDFMFRGATSLNQDLCSWRAMLPARATMDSLFNGTSCSEIPTNPVRWSLSMCQLCPYARVHKGHCADVGFTMISQLNECHTAALDQNMPHYNPAITAATYKDVVDGCSIRQGGVLFHNHEGICEVGHPTPEYVPPRDGIARCLCSDFQPCLCRNPNASSTTI